MLHSRTRGYVAAVSATVQDCCSEPAGDRSSSNGLVARSATNQNSGGRLVTVESSSVSSADHLDRDRWSGPGGETNRRESVLAAAVVLRPSGDEAPSDGRAVITDLSL